MDGLCLKCPEEYRRCVTVLSVIQKTFCCIHNPFSSKEGITFFFPQNFAVLRGGVGVFNPPPPEILKALQNRAKLNPIVKTVKNC